MKLATMSFRKQMLRIAASSARSGGTRRVFTSPQRGALAITASAHTPEWCAWSFGTLASSHPRTRRASPSSFARLGRKVTCHEARQQAASPHLPFTLLGSGPGEINVIRGGLCLLKAPFLAVLPKSAATP